MSTSWICDFVVLPIIGNTSTELWKLSTRDAKVIQPLALAFWKRLKGLQESRRALWWKQGVGASDMPR